MYIVIGLGNPGKEYEKTRHNMGFMALDLLAQRWSIPMRKKGFHATIGEGLVDGQKVVLAKPDTFMNRSGQSVLALMNWYKCAHEQLLVLYDDVDLPPGDIRIREGGSAGTHNGMRSVVEQLGYTDFPRIRVGIGSARYELIDHVLSAPGGEEREAVEAALVKAADAAELVVSGRLKLAQEKFNVKPSTAKKRAAKAEQSEAEAASGVPESDSGTQEEADVERTAD